MIGPNLRRLLQRPVGTEFDAYVHIRSTDFTRDDTDVVMEVSVKNSEEEEWSKPISVEYAALSTDCDLAEDDLPAFYWTDNGISFLSYLEFNGSKRFSVEISPEKDCELPRAQFNLSNLPGGKRPEYIKIFPLPNYGWFNLTGNYDFEINVGVVD